jgi:phenylalanyl-tRNA synthetase beta chain
MAISMKTSPAWLQKYFDQKLPAPEALAETLTFHAVEVEEITPSYIDLNILPDRAAYLLCHRGAAYELSASLNLPMKEDPLRTTVETFPATEKIEVSIENPETCSRYMAALVTGVKVGPSPDWLREALEAVGQRSINNVVDATNYVMLDIGQPLHAFDADLLSHENGVYRIAVRGAKDDERITTLSNEEYALPEGALLITDAGTDLPIGIAGIKGGNAAQISGETTMLVIESANFDGTAVRRTAQKLKLFTDASSRFQNRPSPALAAYGMREVLTLITAIAGGEVVDVVDAYPQPVEITPVTVSLARINGLLGSSFTHDEVADVLARLGCSFTEHEDVFTVLPPFERRDIVIPEDVVEEVGRILGYDRIPSTPLPAITGVPEQAKYRGIERVRDFLTERGYIEVSTQSFGTEGEVELANPLQQERPWLRASLLPNLRGALTRALAVAPRVLGTAPLVKIFELGTVFMKDGEVMVVACGVEGKDAENTLKENIATLEQELLQTPGQERFSLDAKLVEVPLTDEVLARLGEDYTPATSTPGAYRPFSVYPFALRDIAVWTPAGVSEAEVARLIRDAAGELLVRLDLFDRFEKEGRISYAFRLVFESPERTLADGDLTPTMERITDSLNQTPGFEVR